MPAIDATVGGPTANSYETLAEAQAYMDARLPIPEWDNADSQEALLIMATRVLDALAQPFKTFFPGSGGQPAYYRVRRQWTGTAATSTQKLTWPRIGMFDMNGFPIPVNVIPDELKWAETELAAQLAKGDRTLDNDALVQGLASLKAGSVAMSWKNGIIPQVIPDAVYNLLVQSWLTDELYLPASPAFFDVIGDPNTGIVR